MAACFCGAPLGRDGTCMACARTRDAAPVKRPIPWFTPRKDTIREYTCMACSKVFKAVPHTPPRKYCGPKCAATASKKRKT